MNLSMFVNMLDLDWMFIVAAAQMFLHSYTRFCTWSTNASCTNSYHMLKVAKHHGSYKAQKPKEIWGHHHFFKIAYDIFGLAEKHM